MNYEAEVDDADGPLLDLLLVQALDATGEAIAVYTAEPWVIACTVVYANEALCELSGYAAEHFIGHSALLLAGARPDMRLLDSILPPVGKSSVQSSAKKFRPDGSSYTVLVTVSPLRDRKGRITHYISRQRASHAARSASEEALESMRDASFCQLAAGVAYELEEKLATCLKGLEVARVALEKVGGLAPTVRAAETAASSMASTVRGLRSFAREADYERSAVDVHEALDLALRLSGPVLRDRAAIERHYAPVAPVRASLPRLARLFTHLFRNAGESIPPSMPNANHLTVETRAEGDGSVLVVITDTGVGIEPEDLAFVCDPFFTTKASPRSPGLGLTTVRAEVTSLGGTLRIESIVGRGTRVRITLPVAEEANGVASARTEPLERPSAARLLAVGDTPTRALEAAAPFEVGNVRTVVATWDEAIERIALSEPFDLVVCDTRSPRLAEFRERLAQIAPDSVPRVFDVAVGARSESGVFPRTLPAGLHAAAQ